MKFTVYIRWDANPFSGIGDSGGAWTSGMSIRAESHEEAAQKRVALLGCPERHHSVAVVSEGEPNDSVRLYRIVVPPQITVEPLEVT
jgi:hypothetical protein